MKCKIAKRTVESVAPEPRDVFLWDTEIPGFGVKVTPRGKRVYILQYWYGGRSRRCTIGRHGADLTADEARREAWRLRGLIAAGHDPAGEYATMRSVPILDEFAERYLAQ